MKDKTPDKYFVSFSHRTTQKNRFHKGAQRHQVNRWHRTIQPALAEMLCDICRRLSAFVDSPCSQKGFCSICEFCERYNFWDITKRIWRTP